MRFFVWIDFQYEMAALFLGAVSLIIVYIAWASYPKRRPAQTTEELGEGEHLRRVSGRDLEKNRIPPFLICTYVIIAAWSVAYLIYVLATGSRF